MKLQLEKHIERELKSLDPDLFLDKAWERGSVVYQIRYFIGSGEEPLVAVRWVDAYGNPLPLSTSIVDQVKSQEGNVHEALRQATEHNRQKREKIRAEALIEAEAIAHEHHWERRKGKTSSDRPGKMTGRESFPVRAVQPVENDPYAP